MPTWLVPWPYHRTSSLIFLFFTTRFLLRPSARKNLPTLLTSPSTALARQMQMWIQPRSSRKMESRHLLPRARHPLFCKYRLAIRAMLCELSSSFDRRKRTQWMLLLLFPFLSHFPGDYSSIRTILYTLQLFIGVYPVHIPGTYTRHCSSHSYPPSFEGGCSSISKWFYGPHHRVLKWMYQVYIPGSALPFLSHLLWGSCSSISKRFYVPPPRVLKWMYQADIPSAVLPFLPHLLWRGATAPFQNGSI